MSTNHEFITSEFIRLELGTPIRMEDYNAGDPDVVFATSVFLEREVDEMVYDAACVRLADGSLQWEIVELGLTSELNRLEEEAICEQISLDMLRNAY